MEVLSAENPTHIWPASVIASFGARLRLRYEGVEDSSQDLFLFYLDPRLQPLHYAESQGLSYTVPEGEGSIETLLYCGQLSMIQYSLVITIPVRYHKSIDTSGVSQ
jgi:hypothetical protein